MWIKHVTIEILIDSIFFENARFRHRVVCCSYNQQSYVYGIHVCLYLEYHTSHIRTKFSANVCDDTMTIIAPFWDIELTTVPFQTGTMTSDDCSCKFYNTDRCLVFSLYILLCSNNSFMDMVRVYPVYMSTVCSQPLQLNKNTQE